MQVIEDWQSVAMSGVVLTIGNFDGVHRGHQAILEAGRRRADRSDASFVVMTFEPHPLTILTPQRPPALLTPLKEKLRLLELAGVDQTVVVASTSEFLNMRAETFVREVIHERFRPVAMVEGASFGFGHQREGDVGMLRHAGVQHGFEVEIVEPYRAAWGEEPGAIASSSLVRQLIRSGAVDQAQACLNRPYVLFGKVVHGAGRGAGLGFPTANLDAGTQLIPADGVYAGVAQVDDRDYPAAISIGVKPTFGDSSRAVEVHLLDFHDDLYANQISVSFLSWLRDQQPFPSPAALREQIERDVNRTRELFQQHLSTG